MGDIGIGLYVEKDVANFFKKIMTKVKYISANFFEWSYLNNKDVNNYNLGEIIADLKSFADGLLLDPGDVSSILPR